jgi:hypothetical protein
MAKAIRSGGGIRSNKLVHPKVRTGPSSTNKIRVAAVSELGQKLGTHVTDKSKRLPDPSLTLRDGTAVQVDSGNRRAVETPCKPGGGRNIYRAGFQAQTGAVVKGERNVAPDPPATRTVGRDILSSYGKERSR